MKFLKINEVMALTGLTRSTLYLKIQQGEFPAQVRLGPRSVAWSSDEIADWQAARLAARDASDAWAMDTKGPPAPMTGRAEA
jgi:prophage regulatory protein